MASYLPPTDNLPNFNPGVFQSGDDSGITLSDADQRYVKKSGSTMTGPLSTPVLLVNSINVETKLDDITDIQTATTGITYDNTSSADKTTIANNVTIPASKNLLLGTTNVALKIGDFETRTTGVFYNNSSGEDETLFENNVTIENGKSLVVGSTNIGTEISNLLEKTTGIVYDNSTGQDTTTIENNLKISTGKNLLLDTTNVGTEINKIGNIETATSGITYNPTGDLTTIDNNVTISSSKNLLLGTTNVGTELAKITTLETKTQDLTFDVLNGTSLFVNDVLGTQNHGNVDSKLTTLDGEVDDLQEATTKLTYSNGNVVGGGTEDKSTLDCNVTIATIETQISGISYDNSSGIDKTTIDNNVKIIGTLDIPNHNDVGTKLTNIISDITGFSYSQNGLFSPDLTTIENNVDIPSGKELYIAQKGIGQTLTGITYDNTGNIDSTIIDNNITISTGKRVDTPEIRSQTYRANDNTQMLFQNSSGTNRMVISNQGKVGIQYDTPLFDLHVNGDAGIVEGLTVGGHISAQSLVTYRSIFCYDPNQATNNRWGDNNYPNSIVQSSYVGSSSGPEIYYDSGGKIRFSSTGTYKVVSHLNIDCITQPTGDRTVFAAYISTNGSASRFKNSSGTNAGCWGQCYLRNGSSDTGGRMTWSGCFDMLDYVNITNTSDYVTINTRMYFNNSTNLTFQDDAPEANYDVWCYVEVEKISDSTSLFTTMPTP